MDDWILSSNRAKIVGTIGTYTENVYSKIATPAIQTETSPGKVTPEKTDRIQ